MSHQWLNRRTLTTWSTCLTVCLCLLYPHGFQLPFAVFLCTGGYWVSLLPGIVSAVLPPQYSHLTYPFKVPASLTTVNSTSPLKLQVKRTSSPSFLCKLPSKTLGLKSRSTELRLSSTPAPFCRRAQFQHIPSTAPC
jgi:hypothetical protein